MGTGSDANFIEWQEENSCQSDAVDFEKELWMYEDYCLSYFHRWESFYQISLNRMNEEHM